MSKLGKMNILIPQDVNVVFSNGFIDIKGPNGSKKLDLDSNLFDITINKNKEAQRALVTEKLRHKGSRSQMDNNAGSEKWAKKSSGSKMSGRGGGPRGRSNSNGSSFRRFKESNSGKALTAQPPSPTNDNNSDNILIMISIIQH